MPVRQTAVPLAANVTGGYMYTGTHYKSDVLNHSNSFTHKMLCTLTSYPCLAVVISWFQ